MASFSDIATGCDLYAFELGSGDLAWKRNLVGVGPVAHSKYYNRVQLRLVDGRVVAFGNEAFGKYVEAYDPLTGDRIYHRKLDGEL